MAAGRGERLRPVTDLWPKAILPIDGSPVIVGLLEDLAAAGIERFVVVTGHLAGQVEALIEPLPLEIRLVRQPEPLGSLDAVRRAQATTPFLAVAADTRFAAGDLGRFLAAAGQHTAIAVRRQPDRPDYTRIQLEDGRVVRVIAPEASGDWTAAPLWLVGDSAAAHLDDEISGPPFELADVFQNAIDAGVRVSAIEIGRTRDLTTVSDLVRENFPYLR
ncbi:MAG TPA: NTP transferase domain-containing protein [Gaiellaceae bacterium]|jgi:NDP-sugar pyrophosphorylase family protein